MRSVCLCSSQEEDQQEKKGIQTISVKHESKRLNEVDVRKQDPLTNLTSFQKKKMLLSVLSTKHLAKEGMCEQIGIL